MCSYILVRVLKNDVFYDIQREPPNIKVIVFSLWNDFINCRIFYYIGNKIHIRKPGQTQVVEAENLETNLITLNNLWDLLLSSNILLILRQRLLLFVFLLKLLFLLLSSLSNTFETSSLCRMSQS